MKIIDGIKLGIGIALVQAAISLLFSLLSLIALVLNASVHGTRM